MPLLPPNLDDRTFDQIVDEAVRRIPRYAPEWTDHNETDPGITLVQLFAWMTEMTLYRLNQVPERSYIKFLQLLGIELEPARPARAELTFELARDDVETVIVPLGTEVASAGGDGEPLVFETDEALIALGAKLAAVQSFDGFAYSPETTRNAAADQWFHPFGAGAREGGALVLGFDSPLSMTSQQINLAVEVFSDDASPEPRCCELDLAGTPPPSTLEWEYWDRRHWQPLSLDKDETRAFTRSGHVYLQGPGDRAERDFLGTVADRELFWLRCRLVRSGYDRAPRLRAVLTNTVRATQAQTVRDEVLGGSDGRPDQSFTLANVPVVVRDRPLKVGGAGGLVTVESLLLEVNEGATDDDFEAWEEVDDFFASGPDDPHYLLDRTTGEVRFGDGRNGRIPIANPDRAGANIVAREYRYGGGRRGNVGSGTLTELQSLVDGVAEVSNRRPAFGGSDEETVDEAKLRAPGELKARNRAVTAEDFELLARKTPGVRIRRAKALPLHHPRFPDADIPGVVTVVVVPDNDSDMPVPSEATMRAVCVHLNRYRLLTSEVYVEAPQYHEVVIEADVVALADADLAEVKRGIEEALVDYFHPLRGGENGQGWEFGRDIFYSRVYRVLLDVEGVDRVRDNQLEIWLDGERQAFCRDVPLVAGALLYSGEHRIGVTYDRGEG